MNGDSSGDGKGKVDRRDVLIIGSGPAGLAAALYAARAQLNTLVLTGNEIGGQLSLTLDIENYPGFKDGHAGNLIQDMQEQAKRFGAQIEMGYVTEVDFSQRPFRVKTYGSEIEAQSVVVTTGSSPRKLDIRGELDYVGKGVSYCATCDGFFFKGKEIIVVGGGDAAVEEGLFLTRFATTVTIVHRRDRLRANPSIQARAFDNPKMKFIWDTVVTEVLGNDKGVYGVKLKNVKTGEEREFRTDGVFIFVGHIPNTGLFEGKLRMDEKGYLITDKRQHTNVEGVFAAGDVQDHVYRQAITAAGTGAAAAIEAERFLAEMAGKAQPVAV
ncbi:MAG: thioredoxin-disulfide reductase [Candidatus Handelsmanbacteria bacterium RIFCSPLOWO2_12_FULL_64_10]|uniref:Thioredoxin reductase n=1 Tax=Handelsmanbacteria sp. (strain RIFCSPLOWO2_12_FULL_64_10) TaxID=1817868 RepID=A0A1F6CBM2_HANXR|nr:MAG: thioredoxin-disulfide reductase [Candidatus Handelsmanbacteria bacterium RIFCSPLOWO2_12_FULL_64_10]